MASTLLKISEETSKGTLLLLQINDTHIIYILSLVHRNYILHSNKATKESITED